MHLSKPDRYIIIWIIYWKLMVPQWSIWKTLNFKPFVLWKIVYSRHLLELFPWSYSKKKKLTEKASSWLIREVTNTETVMALKLMSPTRLQVPMVFMLLFFQQNWNLLKRNIIEALIYFFRKGKLLREINHSFLTLVPKCLNASSLSDFWHIACCNVIYTLISKILINRLKVGVGELISPNQSAFLKGWHVGDCTLLA